MKLNTNPPENSSKSSCNLCLKYCLSSRISCFLSLQTEHSIAIILCLTLLALKSRSGIIHRRVTGTMLLRKCHSNHISSIRLVIISSKATAELTFKFAKLHLKNPFKKKCQELINHTYNSQMYWIIQMPGNYCSL